MGENEKIILFPNTTAEKVTGSDEQFLGWRVTADEGYVMHASTHDREACDDEGNPTGGIMLGYTRAAVFVQHGYEFEKNPRQIYAQRESDIPEPDKQIH